MKKMSGFWPSNKPEAVPGIFCTVIDIDLVLLQTSKTMSASTKRDGLSARQKTSLFANKFRYLPNPFWVFLVALSLMVSSCQKSSNGQDKTTSKDTASVKSSHKPEVNIKVNKHYDDKGNVIGFDSTYTSYYSNIEGDTGRMDTLMRSFDRFFDRNHFRSFGNEFNSLFFNDSLRYPDFFHDDFFLKRYELNDSYFRDMMNRMDSIKNRFYKERSDRRETKEL
jgi:hypothetical protein